MKKLYAMRKVNNQVGDEGLLNDSNTCLSNINTRKQVWWFTISPQKFKNELHLLCAKKPGLIWLRLDADTFPSPADVFKRRRNCKLDVEICSDDSSLCYMHDIRSIRIRGIGYDFRPHIEYEWDED